MGVNATRKANEHRKSERMQKPGTQHTSLQHPLKSKRRVQAIQRIGCGPRRTDIPNPNHFRRPHSDTTPQKERELNGKKKKETHPKQGANTNKRPREGTGGAATNTGRGRGGGVSLVHTSLNRSPARKHTTLNKVNTGSGAQKNPKAHQGVQTRQSNRTTQTTPN